MRLFLTFLLFWCPLQSLQVRCPHGCCQRGRDRHIVEAKKVFKRCLFNIERKASYPYEWLYWTGGPLLQFGGDNDDDFYITQLGMNGGEKIDNSWTILRSGDEKPWGDAISSSYDYSDYAKEQEKRFSKYGIGLTQNVITGWYEIVADLSSPQGFHSFEFYASLVQMCPGLSNDVKQVYEYYFDLLDREIVEQKEKIIEIRIWLKELSEEYQNNRFLIERECSCSRDDCTDCNIRKAKEEIELCHERKEKGKNELADRLKLIEETGLKIDAIYRCIYDFCIQNHQNPWSYYQRGLLNFHEGIFDEALDDIAKLLEAYQKPELAESLPSEVYFHKGTIEGEVGLYHQAILSLTQAIEQNPQYKDAYFERAVAYFEMGEFDLALKDYLVQRQEIDFSPLAIEGYADFSLGLLAGAKNGILHASTEFLPSILGSLQGIGNFIWATLEHPIEMPKQLATATIEFCNYLRSCEKSELAQILVPEMYELIVDWDHLTPQRRGELTGYSLGKYGTDFLLPIAVLKGAAYVKTYQEIKKAEKLCTLETLASSSEGKEVLTQTASKWNEQRATWVSKVEIEMDKQGKHIRGHKNYSESRSEWTHPFPEKKIKELAGKGQRIRGEVGQAGYQERIDCGEIIGYFVNDEGTERIPTTIATIHYSKKGAHIVPARPKK